MTHQALQKQHGHGYTRRMGFCGGYYEGGGKLKGKGKRKRKGKGTFNPYRTLGPSFPRGSTMPGV